MLKLRFCQITWKNWLILELKKKNFVSSHVLLIDKNSSVIKLSINIDSLSFFKSSSTTFWLLLGSLKCHAIFLITLYCDYSLKKKIRFLNLQSCLQLSC